MKTLLSSIFLLVAATLTSYAQNYWQQEVNYKIDVKLDDENHFLHGFEEMEYINNSPDQLDTIFFHIWPNAYKNASTALGDQLMEMGDLVLYNSTSEEKGFIDSLNFKVDNKKVKWEYTKEHIDICFLILNKPLASGESIKISTPFRVKIPSGDISRLGHIGQSYQITQWYPKPAVYDKNGWHEMPYIQHGEFYSEYGSFDVKITLPKNYRVGATGDLIGDYAETEKAFIDSIAEETKKYDLFEKDMNFPKSSKEFKTINLYQENVHDFAWFADKRYHILKGEVKLPNSGKTVDTYAYFTNSEAELWKRSIEYLNDATYYYSLWNGDYPYQHVTAVDGTISAGGGMEYPNVTVIGNSGTPMLLEIVIVHEVGHNWFYGILGSNERDNAWMDEGINSYNEKRYLKTKYPDLNVMSLATENSRTKILGKTIPKYDQFYFLQYLMQARAGVDQPIQLHSAEYTSENYGMIVYAKTAASFHYLSQYLGQKTFDKCMKRYYSLWNFKHPDPEEIQKVFEEVSGKDLNWFFEDLIKTDKHLDYRISNYDDKSDSTQIQVTITNKGGLVAPFSITAYSESGYAVRKAWYSGIEGKAIVSFPKGEYSRLVIDGKEETIEIYRDNNRIKTKGPFKTFEPVKFELIGNLENSKYNQIFWTPVIGWNQSNGTLLGFDFYNKSLPQEKFKWHLMPLLGTQSRDLNGSYSFAYNWFKLTNKLRKLTIGTDYKRYGTIHGTLFNENEDIFNENYSRSRTFVSAKFKKSVNSPITHYLTFNNYNIQYKGVINSSYNRMYNTLAYEMFRFHALGNQSIKVNFEGLENTGRLSLEYQFDRLYPNSKKHKGVEFRVFAGTFLYQPEGNSTTYRYRLSSWTGKQDLYFDNLFLGRMNSNHHDLLSRQMVMSDGGFIYQHFYGQSTWLVSGNFHFDLPIPKTMLVLNAAYLPATSGDETIFLYEVGVKVNLIKDMVEVYVPITAHQQIIDSHNLYGYSFLQSIRFTLNLNKIKIHNIASIAGY